MGENAESFNLEFPQVSPEEEKHIVTSLIMFGANPKHSGFFLLKDCFVLASILESRCEKLNLSKRVYPVLAKRYFSTVSMVERNIRFTINQALETISTSDFQGYFGDVIFSALNHCNFTNKSYITTVMEFMKLNK